MSNIKQYLTKDKLCLLSLPSLSLIVKDNIFAGITLTIFTISFFLVIIKSLLFGLFFFTSYLLGCLSLHLLRVGNITVSVQSLVPTSKSKKLRLPTSSLCDICGNANCTKHNSDFGQLKPWMELMVDPQVDAALEELLGLLLKEHVYSWYKEISQDESFVHEVKQALRFLFSSLFKRVKQVDIPHLVLGPVLQAALQHVEMFMAGRRRAQSPGQVQEAVLRALGPQLHSALASRAQEARYLRKLTGLILPCLLPRRLLTCQNAASLVRELLCTSVLLPVMDILADPDVINHLLVLVFDPKPMVEYPVGTLKPVEFLAHFVSKPQSSSSMFKFKLDTILAKQELLYTFMKFLEDEASVNVLQFCLTVDEFSTKLLNPDLSKEELANLHEQAQAIYSTYMAADAIDRIRFDSAIVEEIKAILDGPVEDVTNLRTTNSLFKAHQQAYLLLENNLCPLFHHSDKYLALLTGGREEDSSASRHDRKLLHSQSSFRLPSGLPRPPRDPTPPVDGVRMESPIPQTPELLFTAEEEQIDEGVELYRMDSDPRLKNLGAWRVSIPKVMTSIDQKCHFYETFIIEVQRIDGGAQDSPEDLHWTVERRYHEFYVLEAKLIEFHRELPDIHLPPRRTLGRKGIHYLESQRPHLEQFLQRLLSLPALQCSELLYKFLKSPAEFTSSFLPDLKLGKMIKNVPKKLVKEKGQHLNPFLQAFINSTEASKPRAGRIGAKSSSADAEVALKGSSNSGLFQRSRPSYHEEPINMAARSSQSITLTSLYESLLYLMVRVYNAPMWLLQLLSVAEGPSRLWLQKLAEHFIRDKLEQALRPGRVVELVQLLKELLFLDKEVKVRSPREKSERAREAFQQVMDFFPELVARTLGKENHKEGTQLLFNLLQYPLLNKQLTYVLLDIAVQHLFPELESSRHHP